MGKELIKEAFRLQTLAGLNPINECGCEEEPAMAVQISNEPQESPDFVHGEEDHEGYMAHAEIKSLISNASKLEQILKGNPELPGWVSGYITLASDYMNSVTQYLGDQTDTEEYDN